MARTSTPVEPRGVLATARHYIRNVVSGANDGIIATFAYRAGGLVAAAVGEAVF